MGTTEYRRICNLIHTAAEWRERNTVLLEGELGIESDTHKAKYGDGYTAWNSLPYTGTEVDLSNYYRKDEVDFRFVEVDEGIYNIESGIYDMIYQQIIPSIEAKAEKSDIPTKTSQLENDSDYTTNEALESAKQGLQAAIDTKVDTTTYEGKINEMEAEIGDRYTKSEVDIKVNEAKGETGTVETKVDTHIADNVKHITAAERTSWNGKTTMVEVEAKDYATHTELTTVENKIPTTTETWTFTLISGATITKEVYLK